MACSTLSTKRATGMRAWLVLFMAAAAFVAAAKDLPMAQSLRVECLEGLNAIGMDIACTYAPLLPDKHYNWSVRWSNGMHEAEPATADFHIRLFAEPDWHGAVFVGQSACRYIEGAFKNPSGQVSRVMAYVAAFGGMALQVNGESVGGQIGVSVWLKAAQQITYQAKAVPAALLKVNAHKQHTWHQKL